MFHFSDRTYGSIFTVIFVKRSFLYSLCCAVCVGGMLAANSIGGARDTGKEKANMHDVTTIVCKYVNVVGFCMSKSDFSRNIFGKKSPVTKGVKDCLPIKK
jgi:hypothetical protein